MQLAPVWAFKLRFKKHKRQHNAGWQSDVWSDQRQEQKGKLFFFCKRHHFRFPHASSQIFDLPLITPRGLGAPWRGRSGTPVEKRGIAAGAVVGKSANPLTGFRGSRRHQWAVGGVKAARCDMSNLGPRAVKELGPVQALGSHDTTAMTEASAPAIALNYQDGGQ